MKLRVYSNSAFLLRAAIGFSRRVTSAGGRLLFFQSVFNLLLHIMHLFPSDHPPSILFAKKFRIHASFIATPPQKNEGNLEGVEAFLGQIMDELVGGDQPLPYIRSQPLAKTGVPSKLGL